MPKRRRVHACASVVDAFSCIYVCMCAAGSVGRGACEAFVAVETAAASVRRPFSLTFLSVKWFRLPSMCGLQRRIRVCVCVCAHDFLMDAGPCTPTSPPPPLAPSLFGWLAGFPFVDVSLSLSP